MSTAIDPIARELGSRGSRIELSTGLELGPSADVLGLLAGVVDWWAARVRMLGLGGRWESLEHALGTPLPDDIAIASPTFMIETSDSHEQISGMYLGCLSADTRARYGRHYTPAKLANQLWTMARQAANQNPRTALTGLVRDPACGTGTLLLAPLREHLAATARTDPLIALRGLPNFVHGTDSDPVAVWLANVLLAAEMLPVLATVPRSRRRPLPSLATVGDGLVEAPPTKIVIMNPPYGRVRLADTERERFETILYGHANLYGLFMAAGLWSLQRGGVLAALVPTSFTAGLYFTKLRQQLSKSAALREMGFVADRSDVFAGVLQETCLAVFNRRGTTRTTLTAIGETATPVARVRTPRGGQPWLLPRRSDDAPVAAAAAQLPLTLATAGWKATTGPLVWNRRKKDLYDVPGPGRVRIVWAADLDGGTLHQDAARDKMRYLAIQHAADRKTMVLDGPALLVQRTTAPEQSRRIVLAELGDAELESVGGEVAVENHVNVLRPNVETPLVSRRLLTRILSTTTMDRVMRCLSGSVAVSAYELESLPLPDEIILKSWEDVDDDVIEGLVAAAYRLIDDETSASTDQSGMPAPTRSDLSSRRV